MLLDKPNLLKYMLNYKKSGQIYNIQYTQLCGLGKLEVHAAIPHINTNPLKIHSYIVVVTSTYRLPVLAGNLLLLPVLYY